MQVQGDEGMRQRTGSVCGGDAPLPLESTMRTQRRRLHAGTKAMCGVLGQLMPLT